LTAALGKGFEGLRLSGNTFWLEKAVWEEFRRYEEAVNNVIGQHKMLAMCTYSLERCGATEILDVVANHEFALIKRQGRWEIIQSTAQKHIEERLKKSELTHSTILQTAQSGFWLADMGGKLLEVNQAYCRMSGYSQGELLKMSVCDLEGSETPEDTLKHIQFVRGTIIINLKPSIDARTDFTATNSDLLPSISRAAGWSSSSGTYRTARKWSENCGK
jgi:PAS domain-containing protein